MNDIVVAFLGPFTNLILALSFVMVVLTRHAIRKRHIVILLLVTVVSFVAFFVVLIWGFKWPEGKFYVMLYQNTLRVLAAIAVGCGSAIGFSFILKRLGFAKLEDS